MSFMMNNSVNISFNFLMCLLIIFEIFSVMFSGVNSNEFSRDGEYLFLQFRALMYCIHRTARGESALIPKLAMLT